MSLLNLPRSLAIPELLLQALEKAEFCIMLFDADSPEGPPVYANAACHEQFGFPAGQMPQFQDLRLYDENGGRVEAKDFPVRRVLISGLPVRGVIMHSVDQYGETRWMRVNACPVNSPDSGELQGVAVSASDMTRSLEQEHNLMRLAHYDALTELPNRVLLADRMEQALARAQRTHESFAVGMLDLDGFKPVNDTYGHKAGDLILREVAERVQYCLREGDTVARMGGDEFALLLTGFATLPDCERVLKRVLSAISAPYIVEGDTISLSASVGVTLYPNDLSDPDKLLRHADQAMYQAKQEGKNRIKYFDSGLERRFLANQGAMRKIGAALEHGQFELHYQPVVDCRHGRVVSAEALIRWRHPILGLLTPAEFLPLIEQDELIVTLGKWTMNEALRQIAEWQRQGIDLVVSVNVSSRQLHQRQLADELRKLVAEHGVEVRGHFGIEIVETAVLEDIGTVAELTGELRASGIHVALDDFGTGYSSLIHLRRMPVDSLKIDQSFVHTMLDDPLDLAIVEGVIGLAQAFQCRVVAEGVESIEHILTLLELGCDHMQGKAIARPMAAPDFAAWVRGFKPDPVWRMAEDALPSGRHDSHVCLAGINHRHWVDRLIASAEEGKGMIREMDYRACRFGQWYYGEGMARYGERAEFKDLEGLHQEAHALGEELYSVARAGGTEAEREMLVERLKAVRERLMAGLDRLLVSGDSVSECTETGHKGKEP